MFYLHLSSDEFFGFPENAYMELDSDRWQTKVIEIFKDGKIAYAYDDIEFNTFLAEMQYPEPYEINDIEGYDGIYLEYITKDAFYNIWNHYVEN